MNSTVLFEYIFLKHAFLQLKIQITIRLSDTILFQHTEYLASILTP